MFLFFLCDRVFVGAVLLRGQIARPRCDSMRDRTAQGRHGGRSALWPHAQQPCHHPLLIFQLPNHQQPLTNAWQTRGKISMVIYAPILIFWYLEVENFSEKGLYTKMTINLNVFTTEDWPEEFIKSIKDLMYFKLLHKVNTLERTRQ